MYENGPLESMEAQGYGVNLIEEVLKEEWRKKVEISDQKWEIRNRRSAGGQPTANRQLTKRSADHQAVRITVWGFLSGWFGQQAVSSRPAGNAISANRKPTNLNAAAFPEECFSWQKLAISKSVS